MSERRSELKAVASADEVAANRLHERDFMQITARMMDGWSQVNSRLISLAQTSLRNNLSAAEELRQCQSPKDMVDCQLRLARQAYDEYMDEARQLGEIVTKLSTEAMGMLSLPR
ncbi:MAG: phasin family protein [Solirubrobacterales bacterium]